MTVDIIESSKTMSKGVNIYAVAEFLVKDLLNQEISIFPHESRGEILRTFFELCHLTGLSFDELYQRYIIKNTLNKFRQDNGYTDGSYIKIWHNGKEDNAFAVMFIICSTPRNYTWQLGRDRAEAARRWLGTGP